MFSSPFFPVVSFLSLFVCKLFWLISITHTSTLLAGTNKTDPTQYVLTQEQMIENDYPIPSDMADVFVKPAGWVETPRPAENETKWNQKIYAIDCEMVRYPSFSSSFLLFGHRIDVLVG